MKIKLFFTILLLFFAILIVGCGKKEELSLNNNLKNIMQIKSPSFENNQSFPSKYTCDGEGINPPLQISEVPEGTKSVALISDDPDASSGDFVHWLVWNINPQVSEIAEGSVSEGAVEGTTDFGDRGYGAPCPPSGSHHYYFKVYALDIELDLPSSTTKKDLEKAMEGHVLDKAELVGVYSRK
jgi:hypothetical protein